jgi:hypothetical protein
VVKNGVLIAINVPGKKNMPSIAIVFIAKLSLFASIAIYYITTLSSLLALIIDAELKASLMFIFASL